MKHSYLYYDVLFFVKMIRFFFVAKKMAISSRHVVASWSAVAVKTTMPFKNQKKGQHQPNINQEFFFFRPGCLTTTCKRYLKT